MPRLVPSRYVVAHVAVAMAVIITTIVATVVAALLGLLYDTLGVKSAPTVVRNTTDILAAITPGSLLLSRHVHSGSRKRTVFNIVTAASDYYHVGVLLRDPTTGEPMVLDCMANGETCDIPCRGHRPPGCGGPRIMPVMQFMLLYSLNPGTSSVRVLSGGSCTDPEFARRAWDLAVQYTRYDFLAVHEFFPKLVQAMFERVAGVQLTTRSAQTHVEQGIFCSEMAAQLLMELGVLNPTLAPASFAPWSFCRADTFERHLLAGYRYGQPLMPHVFEHLLV